MYSLFLSTNSFQISPGIVFPVDSVLGISLYPPALVETKLYLKSIELLRGVKHDNYRAVISIASGSKVVAKSITEPFSILKDIQDDYVFHFIDPDTSFGCGCMVVTKPFITWLMTTSDIFDINAEAIMINPMYVHNTLTSEDAYISVNNTKVDRIVFNNIEVNNEGACFIDGKIQASPEDIPSYMTALRINDVLLKGKSIGFTIAPPSEGNCRVGITTEDGRITFTDQSVSS